MKILSLDVESAYNFGKGGVILPWMKGFYLSCVGLVTKDEKFVVWFDHDTKMPTPDAIEILQENINWADVIVGHNIKFDVNVLRYHCGIKFKNTSLFCTMIGDYLITGQNTRNLNYKLGDVSKRYGLPGKIDKVRSYWDDGVDTCAIPEEILTEYVLDDAEKPFLLYPMQLSKINKMGLGKVVQVQNEFSYVLSEMECNGFGWDNDRSDELIKELRIEVAEIEEGILDIVDNYVPNIEYINLKSHDHLSALLYGGLLKTEYNKDVFQTYKTIPDKWVNKKITEVIEIKGLGFKPLKGSKNKKEGTYKTGKNIIKELTCSTPNQRKIKKLLLKYSVVKKALSTLKGKDGGLSTKVQEDGHIHPSFLQTVTVTGRLSSRDPNGTNLPRSGTSPLKQCIVPSNDGILNLDLSQIEWRGAAYLSQDIIMMKEINEGIDQHSAACVDLMEQELNKQNRFFAKIFNFRMIYRGSAYGFYKDINMPNFSQKKWKKIVKGFYEKYFGLENWQDINTMFVFKHGYLKIPTGRLFVFNKTKMEQGVPIYNEREVANYPVQGIAGGDILPLLAILLRRGLKKYNLKSKFILTVHDNIVFDYIDSELKMLIKLCRSIMGNLTNNIEGFFNIKWNVDLDGEIEIGPDYGSMEEVVA